MNPVLQKIDSLPPELRVIIEGDEIVKTIDEICENFDIPYTWRSELVRATIRILSGLMSPTEFIPFIMDEYFMDREQALQVALQINERIFSTVKPQLASLHNIEDEKLAHRIKVPHKPIYEEISEALESVSKEYNPPLNTYNTASINSVETPTPYISSPIKKTEESIRAVVEPLQTKVELTQEITATENTPLSSSALVNKLNNMRADPYKEKY
jgi:hypothetical protein